MFADTDGLFCVGQHEAEHHLHPKYQGVEIPDNRRLVKQSNAVGRRNAARGFHALLHEKSMFGGDGILVLVAPGAG